MVVVLFPQTNGVVDDAGVTEQMCGPWLSGLVMIYSESWFVAMPSMHIHMTLPMHRARLRRMHRTFGEQQATAHPAKLAVEHQRASKLPTVLRLHH